MMTTLGLEQVQLAAEEVFGTGKVFVTDSIVEIPKYTTSTITHYLQFTNGHVEFEYHIDNDEFVIDRIISSSGCCEQ